MFIPPPATVSESMFDNLLAQDSSASGRVQSQISDPFYGQ
jgi:hypothetical protein